MNKWGYFLLIYKIMVTAVWSVESMSAFRKRSGSILSYIICLNSESIVLEAVVLSKYITYQAVLAVGISK